MEKAPKYNMARSPALPKLPTPIEQIDAEFRAVLEDDVGTRKITSMVEIKERLRLLFGEELYGLWENRNKR
jgi:hypothetical protein